MLLGRFGYARCPLSGPIVDRAERSAESQSYLAEAEIHEAWESDYLNPELDRFYDAAFERLVRVAGWTPGTSVLDAGCGYCVHAARLAAAGVQVTGVDFSPSALGQADEHLTRLGLADRVTLEQGDLLSLRFADETFDGVSCWGVLMHIPEVERAIEELIRVVRSGGQVVLMENNADSWHVRRWEPMLRLLKRLLGRRVNERRTTPRGIEEWSEENAGGLMVRKTNIDWLVAFFGARGCVLKARFAGQFTEAYTSLPLGVAKRAIYRFNRRWFERGGDPRRALGNVLVFEKS